MYLQNIEKLQRQIENQKYISDLKADLLIHIQNKYSHISTN